MTIILVLLLFYVFFFCVLCLVEVEAMSLDHISVGLGVSCIPEEDATVLALRA